MVSEIQEPGHEEWIRRLHVVLQQHFRRAGRGSVQRVETALGIAQGSFRQWRRRGRLGLTMLFRALEQLAVHPARFWVEVFGCDLDPVQLAKHPTGPPKDPVVRRAVARWETRSPASGEMSDELLAQLDALRHEDPKLAVRRARSVLASAEIAWLPRLLAVYGSARRAEARLEQALEALHYALLLAEGHDQRIVRADILQRLGVAHAYTGNHSLGLLFAKQAAYEHQMAGNPRGEGRSLVDQGMRFFHLGQLDDTIAAHKAALRCLPPDEVRNRFAAFQRLAIAHQRQGNLQAAAASVRRAEALAPRAGQEYVAVLNATKAELAIAAGEYADAERCLAEVIAVYRTLSPIDAALASVDLVRTQVLHGDMSSALESIRSMASLLGPLKDNEIVSEALMQLIRFAFAGNRITDRILDQVSREIEKGRARRFHRARGRN